MALRRFGPWLAVASIVAVALALHAQAVFAAVSPEQAVRTAVEARGEAYAGDCTASVSPADVGKICTRLVAERDGQRAYLAGRTFSEFNRWIFVARDGGEWLVQYEEPLDFTAPSIEVPWP